MTVPLSFFSVAPSIIFFLVVGVPWTPLLGAAVSIGRTVFSRPRFVLELFYDVIVTSR